MAFAIERRRFGWLFNDIRAQDEQTVYDIGHRQSGQRRYEDYEEVSSTLVQNTDRSEVGKSLVQFRLRLKRVSLKY